MLNFPKCDLSISSYDKKGKVTCSSFKNLMEIRTESTQFQCSLDQCNNIPADVIRLFTEANESLSSMIHSLPQYDQDLELPFYLNRPPRTRDLLVTTIDRKTIQPSSLRNDVQKVLALYSFHVEFNFTTDLWQ
jgi:hypothetical protein